MEFVPGEVRSVAELLHLTLWGFNLLKSDDVISYCNDPLEVLVKRLLHIMSCNCKRLMLFGLGFSAVVVDEVAQPPTDSMTKA